MCGQFVRLRLRPLRCNRLGARSPTIPSASRPDPRFLTVPICHTPSAERPIKAEWHSRGATERQPEAAPLNAGACHTARRVPGRPG